jgi:hypothetical protein
VRLHVCWGNYEGPHDRDVPLAEILPLLEQANVGGFVLPFANPRHQHEYRVLQKFPLADDQIIAAGVIDDLTGFVEHPEVVADRLENVARDILVNNAGIRKYEKVDEASAASWNEILSVNLMSYVFCAKAAVPVMRRNKGGAIVNVASVRSVVAGGGNLQYDTTKAAVDCGGGDKTSSLAPGYGSLLTNILQWSFEPRLVVHVEADQLPAVAAQLFDEIRNCPTMQKRSVSDLDEVIFPASHCASSRKPKRDALASSP